MSTLLSPEQSAARAVLMKLLNPAQTELKGPAFDLVQGLADGRYRIVRDEQNPACFKRHPAQPEGAPQ